MRPNEQDKPKVLAPPPLFGLLPLALGLGLHFAFPARFLPTGWLQLAIGLPIIALGAILFATAGRALLRANTDVRFAKPTSVIVQHGPFKLSRNPIYLGVTMVFLGIALAVNALWLLVLLPLVVLLYTFGAIVPEERYLQRKFGEEYLAYRSKARRWL